MVPPPLDEPASQEVSFVPYAVDDPPIHLVLPGSVEEHRIDKRTLIGRVRSRTLVAVVEGGWMAVAATKPPALALAATTDPQVLRHARDSVLKDTRGKKQSWEAVERDGRPGFRLLFTSTKDLGRVQQGRSELFVLDDTVVTATAVWAPEVPEVWIDRFFAELKLPPAP